jgi:uncharacterized YigZ family protein
VTGAYRTVDGAGETAFGVRGSEFFGYVDRAGSVDEAESFVERVRDEYPDATHVVPAYRVRVERSGRGSQTDRPELAGSTNAFRREWASDDGEPSGSAGDPALNVLQGEGVDDVVAAVVRYYGGTNLGIGGLVGAYSRAVREAIADAGTTVERPRDRFRAVVDYDDSGTVRSALESAGADFEATYDDRVAFVVDAPVDEADTIRDRLRSATHGRVEIGQVS